jgi:uncharacterized protein
MHDVVVAFSGGVDSSFLLRVATDAVPGRLVALTTVSPTNPEEDTAEAAELARDLGVDHVIVHANELEIPGYAANPVDRCFHCKTNLYEIAERVAAERGIRWIADGVNLDDLGDYRPGLRAATERGVRHPLVETELGKEGIRMLSRSLGLRSWDRPASPCLSSRFAYGTAITLDGLDRVARGEKLLHEKGFRECRVRSLGERARVEVSPSEVSRILGTPLGAEIVAALEGFGFAEVEIDPEGFRSGKLNRGIAAAAR